MADLQDVQDGQLIPVGSKEIEITGSIDKNEWDAKVKKHCFFLRILLFLMKIQTKVDFP